MDVCRVCLIKNDDEIQFCSLYIILEEKENKGRNLADVVMECAPVHIKLNDGLPEKLCLSCFQQLTIADDFRSKCINSDLILREKLKSFIEGNDPKKIDHLNKKTENKNINNFLLKTYQICNFPNSNRTDNNMVTDNKTVSKINKTKKLKSNKLRIRKHLFKCESCEQSFLKIIELHKHIQESHQLIDVQEMQNKILTCNICDEIFTSKHCLITHVCIAKKQMKSEQSEISIQQNVNVDSNNCDTKIVNDEEENQFTWVKTNNKAHYICKICDKTFNKKYLVTTHLRVHNGNRPYFCKICEKSFKFSSNLRNHTVNVHNEKKTEHIKYEKEFKNFEKDDARIQKETQVDDKTIAEQDEKPLLCNICNKPFKYNSNLRYHVLHIHKVKVPQLQKKLVNVNNSAESTCHFCNKLFKRKSLLDAHLRIHTGERPFICHICGKSFAFLGPLKIHLRIHAGDKRHKCDICGKTCTTGSELSIHMKVHSNILPYKCDICGKTFKWNSNCLKHKRKHSGVRNYHCNFCDKSFLEYGTLKTHTRLHLGTLPYKCEICERKFNISYNLKKHMQTHI